jgi:hypothetical protein
VTDKLHPASQSQFLASQTLCSHAHVDFTQVEGELMEDEEEEEASMTAGETEFMEEYKVHGPGLPSRPRSRR